MVDGCCGVVHLAAVSRVVWAEQDPEGCWRTNVDGTRNVLRAAHRAPARPWVLFASSREVYGEPSRLPVSEDSPLLPLNVYGRSKAEGEALVLEAREQGLNTAIVRFANVYGRTDDHPDRVVPAFARGAVEGADLRVGGSRSTFDFTHLDDTVAGVLLLIDALENGAAALPTVHLCTGRATTLGELARIANRAAGERSRIVEVPHRSYDTARFVGDPARARQLLGWRAKIEIVEGMQRLVRDFNRAGSAAPTLPAAVPAGQAAAGVPRPA